MKLKMQTCDSLTNPSMGCGTRVTVKDLNMFGADLPYNMYIQEEESKVNDGWNFDLEDYLAPHSQVPHPWNRQTAGESHLDMDFILVAEFSELEGPREVVHHFALYDRHARGYVRPFAISYITPDSRKLLQFYEEISQQMKKVVRYLKYGNKLVFKNSLEMHLMDLHYTKAEMLLRMRSRKSSHQVSDEDVCYKNLRTLEANITETQNVLHTIKLSLVDKKLEHRFARLEEKAKIETPRVKSDSWSLQEWEEIEATYSVSNVSGSYDGSTLSDNTTGWTLFPDTRYYRPKTVKISSGRQFDIHLQGLHELCSWGHREGMQKLRHLYQFFKRDMAVLQVESNDKTFIGSYDGSTLSDNTTGWTLFPDTRYYRPKTVKISSGRQFDIHLQGLHELCSWGHREGMQKLRHLYQFFKRDMAVLQVESNDKTFMDPGPSALYFGEDCIGVNLLTGVDKLV
uniref:Uncharacterized protein n=1 Tax=Magallana gigas TaxID=29159 RepID=K1QU27_MAGGI